MRIPELVLWTNLINSILTWTLFVLKQSPYEGLQKTLVTSWSTALLLCWIHALPAAFSLFSSTAALFGFARKAGFWLCCVGCVHAFNGGNCLDVCNEAARARVIRPGNSITFAFSRFCLFMFAGLRDEQPTTSNGTSQCNLKQNKGDKWIREQSEIVVNNYRDTDEEIRKHEISKQIYRFVAMQL